MNRMIRRMVILIVVLATIGVAWVPPATASPSNPSAPPPVTPVVEPSEGNAVVVGRVAATDPTLNPFWLFIGNISFPNTTGSSLTVTNVTAGFPGTAITTRGVLSGGSRTFTAGQNVFLPVNFGRNHDLAFPTAPTVRFTVTFASGFDPLVFDRPLLARANSVGGGSYVFPAKASDLDAGEAWFVNQNHIYNLNDLDDPIFNGQRWGHDVGVAKFVNGTWTAREAGAESIPHNDTVNSQWRAWGKPIHSMADGTIIRCVRGDLDREPWIDVPGAPPPPPAPINPAGNSFVIQYGDELALYAHLRNDAFLATLCPDFGYNPDVSVPVKAGQLLGYAGNSGNTSNPHLHFQVHHLDTDPRWDGVPMQFTGMRSAANDTGLDAMGGAPVLRRHDGLTLHQNSLFVPNPCGYVFPNTNASEASYHGVTPDCVLDVIDMAAIKGMVPVVIDGSNAGATRLYDLVFRRKDFPTDSYVSVTAASLASIVNDYRNAGWRVHYLDSYLVGTALRFSVVLQQRPGPAWDVFYDLDGAAASTRANQLVGAGYEPINYIGVDIGASNRWSGLYELTPATSHTVQIVPAANFEATVANEAASNRKPIYADGILLDGVSYITGIFLPNVGGTTVADAELDAAQYQTAYDSNRNAGRLTRAVSAYAGPASAARFVGLWRSPVGVQLTSNPPSSTTATTASFSFVGDNPLVIGYECQLDGGLIPILTPCSSPKSYTGLAVGSHKFRVRAIDREGLGGSIVTYNWTVTAPPTCAGLTATITGSGAINGTAGNDVIIGSTGNDVINGLGGNDTICALAGSDTVLGGDGDDALYGGDDNDTLQGQAGNDVESGGAGADSFDQGSAIDGADRFLGGDGVDTVRYQTRNASVTVTMDGVAADDGEAGEGDDVGADVENLNGGTAADVITGNGLANQITGGPGNDTIDGGKGADTLYGLAGNDKVKGGGGNDHLDAGTAADGSDVLDGGTGIDRVWYVNRTNAVSVSADGVKNDGEAGEKDLVKNVEVLYGGAGNDTLVGSTVDETLDGMGGNDTITGGGGTDVLRGGDGNDSLNCQDGVGGDTADGMAGTDTAAADPGDTVLGIP